MRVSSKLVAVAFGAVLSVAGGASIAQTSERPALDGKDMTGAITGRAVPEQDPALSPALRRAITGTAPDKDESEGPVILDQKKDRPPKGSSLEESIDSVGSSAEKDVPPGTTQNPTALPPSAVEPTEPCPKLLVPNPENPCL